jgi:hypothetical protein
MQFSFIIYVILVIVIYGDMIMNLLIRIYNIYVLQTCELVPIMVIGSSVVSSKHNTCDKTSKVHIILSKYRLEWSIAD